MINSNYRFVICLAIYPFPFWSFRQLKNYINRERKKLESLPIKVEIIRTKDDLSKNFELGIILNIESARVIDNHREQLKDLRDLGIRGITPIHFFNNQYGTACDDFTNKLEKETGLTKLGKSFIEECNKLGIWIDLSHMTDKASYEAVEIAEKPCVTHAAIRELISKKRNQTLSIYKKIKEKDGMIGFTPWTHLIGNREEDYIKQFEYAIDQGLESIIGIGSDFGPPIWTHQNHRSVIHLANSIERYLPQHYQDFTSDNHLRQLAKFLS